LESPSADQIKIMMHSLDDRKQWAPLHYAVEENNLYIFTQLTQREEKFRCGNYLSSLLQQCLFAFRYQHQWGKWRKCIAYSCSIKKYLERGKFYSNNCQTFIDI
jgi:hypothetical protein